jgi:hypothetical protein
MTGQKAGLDSMRSKKRFRLFYMIAEGCIFTLLLLFFSYAQSALVHAKSVKTESRGLINTKASINELLEILLENIANEDLKSLEALAITEEEYGRYIWPEVPWSQPQMNMPFSYYWGDHYQKSSWALRRVLAKHGGKKYTLIRAYFAKGEREYPEVKLYRDTRLIVKDEKGNEKELDILGSILELKEEGRFKVLSYIHD